MSETTESPASILGSIAGRWGSYSALGTFFLYLFGYLALRFQLSVYGVDTGLDVFDERYLFAGSRFLVFLFSTIPNVLLIAFVFAAIFYLPYRLIPASAKAKFQGWGAGWAAKPHRLPLLGTLVALALIQFVLRRCFVFGNLLLAKELPRYEWISAILLTGNANRSLYFTGLVAGVMLSGALLLMAYRQKAPATPFSRVLLEILFFLVAVEFLLLPVNYGILIASQLLPRVSEISAEQKLSPGQQVWLVWEGKESLTYLVQEPANGARSMITIPRKETALKIVAYDRIYRLLFVGGQAGLSVPQEDSGNVQR